jgi:hypothetical protein
MLPRPAAAITELLLCPRLSVVLSLPLLLPLQTWDCYLTCSAPAWHLRAAEQQQASSLLH